MQETARSRVEATTKVVPNNTTKVVVIYDILDSLPVSVGKALKTMALYLVSYNLNKPEQDYPELVDYLYLIGARKVLDSEWLVRSGATRDAVYKGVKAHLESGDGLLVCLVQSAVGDNLTHPLGEI